MRKQNEKHQDIYECGECGVGFPEYEAVWTDPDGHEILKCPCCGAEVERDEEDAT